MRRRPARAGRLARRDRDDAAGLGTRRRPRRPGRQPRDSSSATSRTTRRSGASSTRRCRAAIELARDLDAAFLVTFGFDNPSGQPPDGIALDALRAAAERVRRRVPARCSSRTSPGSSPAAPARRGGCSTPSAHPEPLRQLGSAERQRVRRPAPRGGSARALRAGAPRAREERASPAGSSSWPSAARSREGAIDWRGAPRAAAGARLRRLPRRRDALRAGAGGLGRGPRGAARDARPT